MNARLDGPTARRWVTLALTALASARPRIDALNVFPVADADTGTNVVLTLSAGARSAQDLPEDAPLREKERLLASPDSPYGRCVYRCGNDVCDHQVVNILFENGVTATFNLSAFTNRMARTMKIMCEDGEIRVSEHENRIEVIRFGSNAQEAEQMQVITPPRADGGHSGGDAGLMNDFFSMLKSGEGNLETQIARSVESHYMAAAAERSRLEGQVIDMAAYRRGLREAAK